MTRDHIHDPPRDAGPGGSAGARHTEATFSVADLVESVACSLGRRARRGGVELSVSLDPGLPERSDGDAALLSLLVYDLTSSALASTRHGEVHIRARLSAATGHHDVVSLEVSDTGPGFSAEGLAPGERRPGLEQARETVERLGGRMTLETGAGRDFAVRVTVPLHAHPAARRPGDRAATRRLDAEVLLAGGTPGLQRGLAAACAHLGADFRRLDDGELSRTLRVPRAGRTLVLLDSSLDEESRRRAWALVATARERGFPVSAIDLLPPTVRSDDIDRPDDVETLSKPVVRRALAVHLESEGFRFGTSGPRPSTRALRARWNDAEPSASSPTTPPSSEGFDATF